MSNSFHNQPWNQHSAGYNPSFLQLEDNDFSPPGGNQQLLPQPMFSTNQYYQQNSIRQNPAASSSLQGAFDAPTQQQQQHPQTRTAAFTSSKTDINGNSFANAFAGNSHQASAQDPATRFRNPTNTFQFSSNTAPAPLSLPISTIDNGNDMNYLSSSPGSMHDTFNPPPVPNQQTYYHSSGVNKGTSLPQAKRPRKHVFSDDGRDDDQDAEMGLDQKEGTKAKSQGACGRCKTLKVKCEFKTDTDPCKRCLNGGHECMIPGRKKRRTPPKREHLLNQIRDQAAEIAKLMSQLEATHASPKRISTSVPPSEFSSSSSLHSPVLSPTTTSSIFDGDFPAHHTDPPANNAANKAVEDWIAKAKESLQEFGGFIGIGGAALPRSYLVEEDFEGSGSEDEEYEYVEVDQEMNSYGHPDDPYSLAVEHHDDNDQEGEDYGNLHRKSSASSLSTTGASTATSHLRKKNTGDSARPANLPVVAAPFGLFGNLALRNPRSRAGSAEAEDKGPGISNVDFFKSVSAPDTFVRQLNTVQHQAPHILTRGIITPAEAEKLFQIYFDTMNLSVSLLDPVLYTAQRTFYRSPFLFTVICAVASRFYTERPDLYSQAIHYAQLAAGTALISGNKNVEMVQAYILLSLYPVPARRWQDQRNWLYLGLAIRTATDLNLHLPTTAKPLNENHAREMLNRTRVWLNCFNLDRSTGSQYGKPPIISPADYMANHSENWWRSSPYNMKYFDIHISAYNSELKVMANFVAKIYSDPDHPTGLNKEVDFESIATATDDELKRLSEKWLATIAENSDMNNVENSFRTGLIRLAYGYARLVVLSYGFQHAFGKGDGVNENPFLIRCLSAAFDVVSAVLEDICRPSQVHYFRHGPEAQSVFVTFASAFLIKLLQPKFASYLSSEQRHEIRTMVQRVIDLLGSPEVAIDERHGPKMYSRFLKNLLATPMARTNPSSPGGPELARQRARRNKSDDSTRAELSTTVYTHPSPTGSLSPAPAESALSFDNFAPVGAVDPFVPEFAVTSQSMNFASNGSNGTNAMLTDFFQPPLPFDHDILRSMQSMTDPSVWHDDTLSGLNWSTQFHQNLGIDFTRSNIQQTYDPSMDYMAGHQ